MQERHIYESDKENVMMQKQELDFHRSVIRSEYIKAEEMEYELKQRQNMLNMFQYNKDQRDQDLSQLPYYQLGFGQ